MKNNELYEQREFNILAALKQGYETGDFENVDAYLTDKSIFESQWVLEPMVGRGEIMKYLRGKGKTLKKNNALCIGDYIFFINGICLRLTQRRSDTEVITLGIFVEQDEEGLVTRIDLCDIDSALEFKEEE